MQPYNDIDGDTGIRGYEPGPDFMRIQFKDGSVYLYTSMSAGSANIEQMKRLAVARDGLNSFINKNVKKRYARREA